MATQFVDIIGEGFVQGVPGTFGNCRVFYDDVTHAALHVGPLYSTWNGQGDSSNDGAIAPPNVLFYNVRTYGALGDGVNDDTTFIAAARLAASAYGGIVFYPAGTYISGNQTLYSNVTDLGAGIGATTIKLKNGANTDLLSAYTSNINLAASFQTGSNTGVVGCGIKRMTLDGNKANQSSGPSYPIRGYGFGFMLEEVEVINGYSGGILWDWNGGNDPNTVYISHWARVDVHDNNGVGIQVGGPSDQQWVDVNAHRNGSHCFHIAPNASAILVVNCHAWRSLTGGTSGIMMLIEASAVQLVNPVLEGSQIAQLVILANDVSVQGGLIFDPVLTDTSLGIQLGQQAGDVPFVGQILQSGGVATAARIGGTNINTKILNCHRGAIYFRNELNSSVRVVNYQTSGGFLGGGTYPDPSDFVEVQQTGLTSDHTLNTVSGMQFSADANDHALLITKLAGNHVFTVNANVGAVDLPNGTQVRGYSDAYSTATWYIDQFGNFVPSAILTNTHGSTATSQVLTSSATISKLDGGAIHVTEAGNVTGIILAQAHNYWPDISLVVLNESAFTVTFATEATSHIAGSTGSNVVIAAKSKAIFWWDANTALWYL